MNSTLLLRRTSLRRLGGKNSTIINSSHHPHLTTTTPQPHVTILRHYISRAHNNQKPIYTINEAITLLLDDTTQRLQHRIDRWEKFKPLREKSRQKGNDRYKVEDPVYRNQDETIEINVNLNLDPRKPGQAIRGSFPLPHGTGRGIKLAVFTTETNVAAALESGAYVAGGEDLIRQIKEGTRGVDFDRAVATKDVLPLVQREIARILGPKGLMPSAKLGTVFDAEDDVAEKVKAQLVGLVNYRAEKEGIIHAPIGKASFGPDKLLENVEAFMNGIVDAKPDIEAKKMGKKGRKGAKGKYVLKVSVSSTQGKGLNVDLRTVEPSSPFFMKEPI